MSLKFVKMAELRTDRVKVNSSDAKQHHLGSRCKDQFLFSTCDQRHPGRRRLLRYDVSISRLNDKGQAVDGTTLPVCLQYSGISL